MTFRAALKNALVASEVASMRCGLSPNLDVQINWEHDTLTKIELAYQHGYMLEDAAVRALKHCTRRFVEIIDAPVIP